MTERPAHFFPMAGLVLLVLILAATTLYFGRDEYQHAARDNGETIGNQTTVDEKVGPGRLRIGEQARRASGIELAALAPGESEGTTAVRGVVADLGPLVDARGRYLAQSSEIRAHRLAAANLESEFRRAQALYQDDRNVSERVLRQVEADWKTARERVVAAEAALRATVEASRAAWGESVADMALNEAGGQFRGLLERREVLAMLSLPFSAGNDGAGRILTVEPAGGGTRVRATWLAPAPSALPGAPGATHFYRMAAGELRAGTPLTGHLPDGRPARHGVVVPESAVVWHAGRSWAYARDAKDRDVFVRAPVDATRLVRGGWFNADGLTPGVEVVVTGAQLLLSEELEYQIRNENED